MPAAFAQRASAPEAIGKTVALAAMAAQPDGPKQEIYHSSDAERRVVWDSEKDSFGAE